MPAGRRRQWVALVRSCPACGHAHIHRSAAWHGLAGTARTGSCGAPYRLAAVLDLREEVAV
jgi:hypothetical protein